MVTHDPVAAAWADRVVFLSRRALNGELEAPIAEEVAERMTHLGESRAADRLSDPADPLGDAVRRFVALALGVTLTYATGSLLAGALSAPGPGRFAAADAVVRAPATVTLGTGDDAESVAMVPAPLLDVAAVQRVAAVPGVERAIGDVAFDAGVVDARGRALGGADGHGWPSAALTPYRLRTGRAPERSRDVVADVRLGVRAGQSCADRHARG